MLTIAQDDIKEIPLGFSVAMSCVMGNRLILNVRCLHRELLDDTSEIAIEPTRDEDIFHNSGASTIRSWGTSDVEMAQLRPTCIPGHYDDTQ